MVVSDATRSFFVHRGSANQAPLHQLCRGQQDANTPYHASSLSLQICLHAAQHNRPPITSQIDQNVPQSPWLYHRPVSLWLDLLVPICTRHLRPALHDTCLASTRQPPCRPPPRRHGTQSLADCTASLHSASIVSRIASPCCQTSICIDAGLVTDTHSALALALP